MRILVRLKKLESVNDMSVKNIKSPVHGMQEENDTGTDSKAGSSLLKFKPAQLSEINIYPSEYNHQQNPIIKVELVQNVVVEDNTKNICIRGERDKDISLTTTGRNLLPVLKFEPDPNLPDAGDEESNRPRSGDFVQNTGKQKVAKDITSRSRNLLPMIKAESVQNLPDVDEENNQPDTGDEGINCSMSGDFVQNTGKQKVAQDITARSRNLLPMIKAESIQNLPDVDEENSQPDTGDEGSNCSTSGDFVQNTVKQKVAQSITARSRNLLSMIKAEPFQNLPDVDEENNQPDAGDEESNHPWTGDCVQNTGKQKVAQDITARSRNLLPMIKTAPVQNLPDVDEENNQPDAGDEESNHPMSGDCVQNTCEQKVAEDITSRSRNLLPMIKAEPVKNLPDVDEGNDQSDAGDECSMSDDHDCVQNIGKQKVTQDFISRSRNLLSIVKTELIQNLPDRPIGEGNNGLEDGDECSMSDDHDYVQNIGKQKFKVAQDITSRSKNLLPMTKTEPVQNLPDADEGNDQSDAGDECSMSDDHDCVQNFGKQKVTQDFISRSRNLLSIVKTELIQNMHDIGEGNNELEDDDSVQNNQSNAEDISMSRNRMSPCVCSSEEFCEERNILPEVEQNKNSLIFNSYTKSSFTGSDECVNLLELQQNETLSNSQDKTSGRKANMTESFSCTPDPEGQRSSFPSRSNHTKSVKQHCLQSCTVPLTRIDEQISKGHCIVNTNVVTYSEPKGFRIRPVQNKESQSVQSRVHRNVLDHHTTGDCTELDESDNSQVVVKMKSGRKIKLSKIAYVDKDSEREDGVQNETLSVDGNCDDSETDENEGYSSTRKDCLGLLRAQDKDKSESYMKKKSSVDSKTLNKYMNWNADIICLVCQKIMTSLTEWKKHYYNWTECSSFFVDEENCCLTCPPCKESFSHFTDWSRHMFMGGPHGDWGSNVFPRGFINSFLETNSTMLQKADENKIMNNTDQQSNTTESTVDKNYQNYLTIKQQIAEEEEEDTVLPQLNKQCFRFSVGYVCKICKRKPVYWSETSAVIHVYDVHVNDGKPEYRCKICNQYFKTRALQVKHRIDYHQVIKKKCSEKTCHICGIRSSNMSAHIRGHSKEVPCIVCGTMIKEAWMREHIKYNHSGVKRCKYKRCICEVCGKVLSSSSIKSHRMVHSENRKRVKCSLCKSVVLEERLSQHMDLRHSEGQHQCEFCGKQFMKKFQLTYHIQRAHLKTATKTCKICGASVKNLDLHMKCHQEKLFACSICGKEFRLKHHLNTHVNGVHENIRPFKCPVCDFKFTLKHHLTAHMNAIHNMEKKSTTKTVNRKKDGENTESDGHTMKRKKRKVSNEKDTKLITQSKKSK